MAYKVVPTQITGDYWTAGNNNTYIRDNFRATLPALFTAAGQMVYGTTSTDSFGLLPIGTYPNRLTVNAGATAPEWKTPQAKGILLIDPYIVEEEEVAYDWNNIRFLTKVYDGNDYFQSTDLFNQIKIPSDGIYQVSGFLEVIHNGSGTKIRIGPDDFVISSEEGKSNYLYFCNIKHYSADDLIYCDVYNPGTTVGFEVQPVGNLSVLYLGATT